RPGDFIRRQTCISRIAGFDRLLAEDGAFPSPTLPALIAYEVKVIAAIGHAQQEIEGFEANLLETFYAGRLECKQHRLRHLGIGVSQLIAEPVPACRIGG